MSFFWTISTSATEGPLLIEILQKVQKTDASDHYKPSWSCAMINRGKPVL